MTALLALLLLGGAPRPAAPDTPRPAAARASLAARLDTLLAAPALRHASVGVVVRSLDTGRDLYVRNPDLACAPASNQKLVTAAAALALLGSDFRFSTRVARHGDDLYLVGGGDPTLDLPRLKLLALAVRASGVTRVAGRVLGDPSAFSGPVLGAGWQWDDEPFAYSAPVSGLNVDGNVQRVSVRPGTPPSVVLEAGWGRLEADVRAAPGALSAVTVTRRRGTDTLVVSGALGEQAPPVSVSVTVDDPAAFAAHRFAEALREAGIETGATGVGVAPDGAQTVAQSESEPLSQWCARFLKPSDNLMGECLLRAIGRARGGAGTVAAGVQAVRAWLDERRLPLGGVAISDGSGLSMQNTLTARFVAALLTDQAKNAVLRDALPVAGVDGTLRGRFQGTPAAGNVRAKTGTLTIASSLSGYVATRSGERLVFAILMNHFDRAGGARAAQAIQDAVALALVDLPRAAPGRP